MLTTILLAIAIVGVPAAMVVATLLILGTAVAGLVDGAAHGLVRPNAS
jgi:hypothetical protein